MRLGDLTFRAIEQLGRPVLFVPLGSTEQHGPHLPIDTDTRIAVAWTEQLVERAQAAIPALSVVAAPPLAYGSAGEHQPFAGTLSIGSEALRHVLVELVRSASHSFDAVVFVSGHAGNARPVLEATAQMIDEGHRVHSLFPQWDSSTMGFDLDAHAGRVETSLMLHIAPKVVDLDRAEPGALAPLSELIDELRSGGVAAVSANGVLGDPAQADAEEGRRLLHDLVARSLDELAAFFEPHKPSTSA